MNIKKLVSAVSALAMSASVFAGLAVTANAADTPLIKSVVIGNGSDNSIVESMTVSESASAGALSVPYGETGLLFPTNRISTSDLYNEAVITLVNPIDISQNDVEITWTQKVEKNTYGTNGKRIMSFKAEDGTVVVPTVTDYNWGQIYFNYDQATTGAIGGASAAASADCKIRVYDNASGKRVAKLYIGSANSAEFDVQGDSIKTISLYVGNIDDSGRKLIVDNLTVSEYESPEDPMYSVTFTESNGVNASVTMNGLDVTSGTDLTDGEYAYTVHAVGYKTYSGTFTVKGANTNVEFAMEAIDAAPAAKAIPENAVATTTYVASGDLSTDTNNTISGYDTYGEGYTWYLTFDLYVTSDGSIRYVGKTTSSGDFGRAGESTSLKLGLDEIRYYTSSSGTWVAGGLSADKWYTVTISSDLANTLSTANGGSTLDIVVTDPVNGNEVASVSDVGFRNAVQGLRYVGLSGTNCSVITNAVSYFIPDPETPATATSECVWDSADHEGEYEGEASAWKVTVTPGSKGIEKIAVTVDGGNADKAFESSTVITEGTVVLGVAVAKAAAGLVLNVAVNGNPITVE
ncbi:MAG: hypothetical protein J1G06_06305 [Oscillospiraceae bacterium]|nr:hypothetical protein [Oscillospiraceae bacterium]